jgi:hypothetical protein
MKKLLMILLAVVCVAGCGKEIGKGTATGIIIELDGAGLVWPTPDLIVVGGEGNATLKSMCSIDPTVPGWEEKVRIAKEAIQSGRRVRIEYTKYFLRGPWHGATNCAVDSITYIK